MKKLFILAAGSTLFFTACKKEESSSQDGTGTLTIEFDHQVGENSLELNSGSYTFGDNENVKISMFKYYVSNVVLTKEDGELYEVPESYHIVDISDAGSLNFSMEDIPSGSYKKMSFMVGVDEARNTAGAQEGALDPAKGMFWSWNTGYIFLKLEGTYGADNENFTYHVGGYSGEFASQQQVDIMLHGDHLEVNDDEVGTAHMVVDLNEFFTTPQDWDIATNPVVTMPGQMAKTISNNYADMFTVHHLHH